ncbi:hypothetical protein BH09PSE6_BH09PSE6_00350 [soil metagenome]
MTDPTLSQRLATAWLAMARTPLPAPIRAQARLHVADSIAIGLAARRSSSAAATVLTAMRSGIESGRCGVYGEADGLPPGHAAFANSALSHILDFDDIHDEARLHPTTVSLPAALAAAGLNAASGERVLIATVLGNELMCRLGTLLAPTGRGPGSDWFLTQAFGYLGAALAAGIVLELDAPQLVSAIGFAYMQIAGGKEAGFGVGANARAIYPAFAAMGGVQAALLARAGMVAPATALDGDAGLFKIYFGAPLSAEQVDRLCDPAGFVFARTEIKPWPSCRLSHPYVATALELRQRIGVAGVAAIERIEISVNGSAAKLCRPLAERLVPTTLQDAKYSIPFMTAFTLVHGTLTVDNLDERAPFDAAVRALAARVQLIEDLPDNPGHPPARVAVVTPAGRFEAKFEGMVTDAATVRAKFDSCLRVAGASRERSEALWHRLAAVDREHDARAVFAAVSEAVSARTGVRSESVA